MYNLVLKYKCYGLLYGSGFANPDRAVGGRVRAVRECDRAGGECDRAVGERDRAGRECAKTGVFSVSALLETAPTLQLNSYEILMLRNFILTREHLKRKDMYHGM